MIAVLLSVHVLAAIVLIGPVTAAASLFPRYARRALEDSPDRPAAVGVIEALYRISSGYAVVAVIVPVFGIATASQMGVLGEFWLVVSMGLTAVAAGLLAVVIVPEQRLVLSAVAAGGHGETGVRAGTGLRRLSMTTGLFALTWAVVVVLMIVRPGSTTGV